MKGNRNQTVYKSYENSYVLKERQYDAPHHRKCIDGSITGCGKCVGYCEYKGHPGFLTEKLRKKHNCIKKCCFYYAPKKGGTSSGFNTMASILATVL